MLDLNLNNMAQGRDIKNNLSLSTCNIWKFMIKTSALLPVAEDSIWLEILLNWCKGVCSQKLYFGVCITGPPPTGSPKFGGIEHTYRFRNWRGGVRQLHDVSRAVSNISVNCVAICFCIFAIKSDRFLRSINLSCSHQHMFRSFVSTSTWYIYISIYIYVCVCVCVIGGRPKRCLCTKDPISHVIVTDADPASANITE
jgi:hypothetical protein